MVLGGASCLWEDVGNLALLMPEGRWDGLVIAVNDVGVHWKGRLDHWVSLHPEKLAQWRDDRMRLDLPGEAVTWGRHAPRHVMRHVADWPGVSSGGLAVQVALEKLGCLRVVLCGVPMTATPHFAESTVFHITDQDGNWAARQADHHWEAFQREAPKMTGKVRSMSGRTRDLLGYPTPDWLNETPELPR